MESSSWPWFRWLIIVSVVYMVTIRFFTETTAILPRVLNGIDLILVPALLPISLLWLISRNGGLMSGARILYLLLGFFIATTASWFLSIETVDAFGAMLFVVGFASPIVFYLDMINCGLDRRFVSTMGTVFSLLLIANLVTGTYQAMQGVSADVADFVFGTFGVNNNQFAFFLAINIFHRVILIWTGKASILSNALLIWSIGLFILAGFQTTWVLVTVILFIIWMVFFRSSGKVWLDIARFLAPIATAIGVAAILLSSLVFPRFTFVDEFDTAIRNVSELGKVRLLNNIWSLIQERPDIALFGTGPATFNSRAFASITALPGAGGADDVAAAVLVQTYRSEISDRFVIPILTRDRVFLSGQNTDGPFASVTSIPVEIGLPGAFAYFGIYGIIFYRLIVTLRRTTDQDCRSLAAWALASLSLLVGLGFVHTFMEATRYTLLVWLIVAIWHVHCSDRHRSSGEDLTTPDTLGFLSSVLPVNVGR